MKLKGNHKNEYRQVLTRFKTQHTSGESYKDRCLWSVT